MPRKTTAQINREIADILKPGQREASIRRLREEVGQHTREASAARNRLDHIQSPSPGYVLRRVDSLLSMAQDQIGRHLTTVETKATNPEANRTGHDIFDAIEAVRRRILKTRLR